MKKTPSTQDQKYALPAMGLVILFHAVGAWLLIFAKGDLYSLALQLTPMNLLFTAVVSFWFQQKWDHGFYLFLGSGFLVGFLIELMGVQTGLPFGSYTYGPVLGIKLGGAPLLIGVNWLLIGYGSGCLLHNLTIPVWLKVVCGSLLLLLLDYFMEPIAMKHGFWAWHNGTIPNQNYIGWGMVSILMMSLFHYIPFEKNNRLAGNVWLVQLGFFLMQNLF